MKDIARRFLEPLPMISRATAYFIFLFIVIRIVQFLPIYDAHILLPTHGDGSGYWMGAHASFGNQKSIGYTFFLKTVLWLFFDSPIVVVIFQHFLVLILGLIWLNKFQIFGKAFTFISAVYFFCNPVTVQIGNLIFRDSLTMILLLSAFYSLAGFLTENNRLKYLLAGSFLGFAALVRQEIIVFFALMTIVITIVEYKKNGFSKTVKTISYFCLPFVLFISIVFLSSFSYSAQTKQPSMDRYVGSYKSYTVIMYHYLIPSIFNYEESKYPDLHKSLKDKYRECDDTASAEGEKCLWPYSNIMYLLTEFKEECQQYQASHNIDNNVMDYLFFEAVFNNPGVYVLSVMRNTKQYLLLEPGAQHLSLFIPFFSQLKNGNIGDFLLAVPVRSHDFLFSFKYLFPFFVLGLIVMIKEHNVNSPNSKLFFWILTFWLLHFSIISIISNTATRFLFPGIPFIAFIQIYGLFYFAGYVRSKIK